MAALVVLEKLPAEQLEQTASDALLQELFTKFPGEQTVQARQGVQRFMLNQAPEVSEAHVTTARVAKLNDFTSTSEDAR